MYLELVGELNKQLAGASDATGSSLQDLGTQFSAAQAAATEAASSITGQLSESTNSALQALPAPVRDSLLAAARPVGKVSLLFTSFCFASFKLHAAGRISCSLYYTALLD